MYEAGPPATTPHTFSSFTTAFPRTTPHKANSPCAHGNPPGPNPSRRSTPPPPRTTAPATWPPIRRPHGLPGSPATRGRHPPAAPPGTPGFRSHHDPTCARPRRRARLRRPERPGAEEAAADHLPAREAGSRRAGPDTGVRAPHSCCRRPPGASGGHPWRDAPCERGGHRITAPRSHEPAPTAASRAFGRRRASRTRRPSPRPKSPPVPQRATTGCTPSPGPGSGTGRGHHLGRPLRSEAVPGPAMSDPYRRHRSDQRGSAALRRCACRRGRSTPDGVPVRPVTTQSRPTPESPKHLTAVASEVPDPVCAALPRGRAETITYGGAFPARVSPSSDFQPEIPRPEQTRRPNIRTTGGTDAQSSEPAPNSPPAAPP